MLLLSGQEKPVSAGRDAWPVGDNDMCTLAEFYQTQFQSNPLTLVSHFSADIAQMAAQAGIKWEECKISFPSNPGSSIKHRNNELAFVSKADSGRCWLITALNTIHSNLRNRTAPDFDVPVVYFKNWRNSHGFEGSWNGYNALFDAYKSFREGKAIEAPKAIAPVLNRQDESPELSQDDVIAMCGDDFGRLPVAQPGFDYFKNKNLAGVESLLDCRAGHVQFVDRKPHIVPGWNGSRYDFVAVPLTNTHNCFCGYQKLHRDGRKFFPAGLNPSGSFVLLGSLNNPSKILLCEGVATGAALYRATGWTVVCALFADNLVLVAKELRATFPDAWVYPVADNDAHSRKENADELNANKGLFSACLASQVLGEHSRVIVPVFAPEDTKSTDACDLYNLAGIEAVRAMIKRNHPINQIVPFVAGAFCALSLAAQ